MTLLTFLLFTGIVAFVTWRLTRGDDHSSEEGYFLAGRRLTGGVIAGSLLLTNLSTEQLVGLNGAAFADGLSVMAWEVVAAVALVALALFFLPRYMKSGIATVPQFLEERFGATTRGVTTMIFVIAYAFILLPIVLYTGARGLNGMLDVASLTGIANETANLWISVWVIGIVGSIYAIWGGLRTVAVSDTLNGFGLLVGGVSITVFGLLAVAGDGGGLFEGWAKLRSEHPGMFQSLGTNEQSVPWHTLFSGVLILNLFYWTTNQQIIQRTFGAKNLAEGQKGVLLAGVFKILAPAILVIPGIIAFHLFASQGIDKDAAYGLLVRTVLPAPLTGFFAAAMVGAILSSFNSALNSTATLYSLGIYKGKLNPNATHERVVKAGKWCGIIVALFAMSTAPLLTRAGGIFQYLQEMNAIYFVPLFCVVLVGLLNKTASERAALVALTFSLVAMILGSFVFKEAIEAQMNFFHYVGLVFVLSVVVMLVTGKMYPRATPYEQQYSGDVDMTPWGPSRVFGICLVGIVLGIYAIFA
jgi:SSS family solute:Na+ symporter